MTDRELLELAAKAAGFLRIDFLAFEDDGLANVYDVNRRQYAWNPLTSDGDALRLAVKLKIELKFHGDDTVETQTSENGWEQSWAWETDSKDLCAATRRAIVKTAAEIGDSHD